MQVPAEMIQELFAKPGAKERHTTLHQEEKESAQKYEELQVSRRLMSEHTVHEREDTAFSHGQVLLKRRKEDQRDRVTSDVKGLFDETGLHLTNAYVNPQWAPTMRQAFQQREQSPEMRQLREAKLQMLALEKNSATSLVEKETQLQVLKQKEREYANTCLEQRDALQGEYEQLDSAVETSSRHREQGKPVNQQKLKSNLERMRMIKAELALLGENRDPFFRNGGRPDLARAVAMHPDVRAAEQAVLDSGAPECQLHQKEKALDDAEQRVKVHEPPPPQTLSTQEDVARECDRVMAAVGPFDVLGLQRDANDGDVQANYFKLLALHPDKRWGSNKAFERINDARDQLLDPEKRAQYQSTYPLDDSIFFNTKLSNAVREARDKADSARKRRLEWVMGAVVAHPLANMLKPKGAETCCTEVVPRQWLRTPLFRMLMDPALEIGVEKVDTNSSSLHYDDDDGVHFNTSACVASIKASIKGLSITLPFELVTLKRGTGGLIMPRLASLVYQHGHKVLLSVVQDLRSRMLQTVKQQELENPRMALVNLLRTEQNRCESANVKPAPKTVADIIDSLESEKLLSSDVDNALPLVKTYPEWAKLAGKSAPEAAPSPGSKRPRTEDAITANTQLMLT
jgi:hypothetical protein